jgi:DnaJ-class molecular chaperone
MTRETYATLDAQDKLDLNIGAERREFAERRGGACEMCSGSGIQTYGNTSTWRHGIGGQAMTPDVCDRCWGSGSVVPWPSWRGR